MLLTGQITWSSQPLQLEQTSVLARAQVVAVSGVLYKEEGGGAAHQGPCHVSHGTILQSLHPLPGFALPPQSHALQRLRGGWPRA